VNKQRVNSLFSLLALLSRLPKQHASEGGIMSMKDTHTFEGVEGVLGMDSVSLEGCNLPFAESSGVDGVAGLAGVAGVAGVAGGKFRSGVVGVPGVCGGGPTWKLGMGTLARSLPFFP
jgi:hypothetical protein